MMASTDQPSQEELVQAVQLLQTQVAQLTEIVKESLAVVAAPQGSSQASASQPKAAAAQASPKVNGASIPLKTPVVKTDLIPGTAASAPPGATLVSVSAAEARIQAFLSSQGKAAPPPVQQPAATAAAVSAPIAAAPAPKAEVAVPAAPAVPAAAPSGEGFVVEIDWDGKSHAIRCSPDTTVLEAAMDAGLDLPHSCMSGSCLTCPGRLTSGKVDQSEGVLEDDKTARGLMLTCVSYPLSDLRFEVITEDELDE